MAHIKPKWNACWSANLQPSLTFLSKHVGKHALWLFADQGAPEHNTEAEDNESECEKRP